jgi:hypothetical protein
MSEIAQAQSARPDREGAREPLLVPPGVVNDTFGPNLGRLQSLKRKYDPDNLVRLNHNISPAEFFRLSAQRISWVNGR